MHVEKQKKNCHNFLKNICAKKQKKGKNAEEKQKKKKEKRHGNDLYTGIQKKKKWV